MNNPFTGLNERGFQGGQYDHVQSKALVTEQVRRALRSPWVVQFLDFWADPHHITDLAWDIKLIRLEVKNLVTEEERTHEIVMPFVEDELKPWSGAVMQTLVAWVEATYGG